ncbi:MAG: fluoride efflux transporter CrcB [Opitutales bacterium]|jgi:CrcB protein|nr:fluoride efflux transporter CrcB [Opitutales bacterium]MDG2253824.1 fluoride efflux transporter CrcB [Opitutaceae bacterium]MBT5168156.1 fluoride efflux transporter CrcB [Opitutales bacterium]MBT5814706.1 fluoride efflux transporter CrcB [Opitutales bacterium]MBT6380008.1 fluoride efflux transporter CrcB [Opitutales bacterium]
MIKAALVVGLGGFVGGSLRYISVVWVNRKMEVDFPLAILLVNVAGSFAIGFMTPGFERFSWGGDTTLPLFLSVGLMGGFTTFSTFSLQTLRLMQSGSWGLAAINAVASVLCCLVFVFVGFKLGQVLFR